MVGIVPWSMVWYLSLIHICTNPAFRQSMSNKDISMFMEALGFKKIHRKTGNGWKVIEMRPDEIENNQKMDGSENIPPGDLPF